MAFIVKRGKSFQVRQGNSETLLKSFPTKAAADAYVRALHKIHKPKAKNKGKVAKKRAHKDKKLGKKHGMVKTVRGSKKSKPSKPGKSKKGKKHR